MYPAVATGEIGGWCWEGVFAVGGVGHRIGELVRGEGVDHVG